jgi:hypothetical protein
MKRIYTFTHTNGYTFLTNSKEIPENPPNEVLNKLPFYSKYCTKLVLPNMNLEEEDKVVQLLAETEDWRLKVK